MLDLPLCSICLSLSLKLQIQTLISHWLKCIMQSNRLITGRGQRVGLLQHHLILTLHLAYLPASNSNLVNGLCYQLIRVKRQVCPPRIHHDHGATWSAQSSCESLSYRLVFSYFSSEIETIIAITIPDKSENLTFW